MKLKINIKRKGAIISLSVLIVTVLADQLTKLAVMRYMEVGQSIPLIKDVLHLTYILNRGAAFGSMSDARWLFMTVSVLLIVFLCGLILVWEDANALFYTAAAMMMGGGIGNMIDRVWLGYVVDFIDFRLINFAIFNVADSFVTVGAGIMMVYLISDMIKETKKEQQKKAELAAKDAEDDAGDDPSEDA